METNIIDILWIVVASGLVFIMQAGFAMVESGLTRSKNSINVAIKNLSDLGISVLGFWFVGFAIMFGSSKFGLLGTDHFIFEPLTTWGAVFFMFQSMFCSTSATIVSGAVAERMKYSSYILATVLMSILIYPVFGHWTWGGSFTGETQGWLKAIGFIDFAGSTTVHSVGGWVSLALLFIIGPRTGRFLPDGTKNNINGSNIPNVVLGVIILWFGWFGFNGGSTLEMNSSVPGIILRTTLAGSAGMIGSLFLGWYIRKRADASLVMNGSLAGLVAITAGVHAFSSAESILIGFIGGIVMLATEELLDKFKIDDAVGAIPVHLGAGIWGTIAVALFGDAALLGTELSFLQQLLVQFTGILSCGIWTFSVAYSFMYGINLISRLRVSLNDEITGLNVAEHGVSTEILDLYKTMDHQAKTCDLTLRVPVEPFTEAGQIASMYNKVIESLENNTIEKGAYLDILQNINEGLFLINPDLTIGSYYSHAMHQIFSTEKISGEVFTKLLDFRIPREILELSDEFLHLCFDSSIKWRNCMKINPFKEVVYEALTPNGDTILKHLNFTFKRIEKNKIITQLLVIVRDNSTEKNLSIEMEKQQKNARSEMELLYHLLHEEPSVIYNFLSNLDHEIDIINNHFQNNESADLKKIIESTFRHTHTIKGEAELLQISFIAAKAEEIENKIIQLRKRPFISPEDFLALTLSLSELKQTGHNVKKLIERWLGNSSFNFKDTGSSSSDPFKKHISTMINNLSAEYGKKVNAIIDDNLLNFVHRDKIKQCKDIIIQLVRNAIYHGIEEPHIRRKRNKDETGNITISVVNHHNMTQIKVKDDGNGINKKSLIDKAIKQGLINSNSDNLEHIKIIDLLFAPGLSTAEKPDRIAGKGVGMGLVKTLIQNIQGRLKIISKTGKFSEFIITIPSGETI